MKLTVETVPAIAPVPPKTEIIVFDDDQPGFGVRARPSGWKVFIVQYLIGNRQRRMSLGKVDDWTSAKLGKWPRKSDRGEDGSRSSGRAKVMVGPPASARLDLEAARRVVRNICSPLSLVRRL